MLNGFLDAVKKSRDKRFPFYGNCKMEFDESEVVRRNRKIIAEIERVEARDKKKDEKKQKKKSQENAYFEYNEKVLLAERMQKENESLRKEYMGLQLELLKQKREQEELQSAVYNSQARRLAMLSTSYS